MTEKLRTNISFVENRLKYYKEQGKKIFISSSFQTHSIPLLHIVTNIDNTIPIYFLDTGFHFPETIQFKETIGKLLNVEVISLYSYTSKVHQKDAQGRFLFYSDTDYCCHINKTLVMEPALMKYDIWITGVRRDQNSNRKKLDYEAEGPFDTIRFHPMLDWDSRMIHEYRKSFNLPEHPLEAQGYLSIGCAPCTQKYNGDGRSGRWAGQKKNECGLHTELIK